MGRDIAASFKNMAGGELKGYTEQLTESHNEALVRMLQQAHELGANAVCNMRFDSVDIGDNAIRPSNQALPRATGLASVTAYKRA